MEKSTSTVIPSTSNKLGLPSWLRTEIKNRNQARKQYQKSRKAEDKKIYNNLVYKIRRELQKIKNQNWENLIDSLETNEKSYWKIAKCLRNKKQYTPPLVTSNGIAYTTSDKAEAFADSLEEQCSLRPSKPQEQEHIERIHTSVENITLLAENIHDIDFVTPEEVYKITSKANPRKAPGPDGITNTALRQLPKKAIVALCNITNACLRLGHYPECWKLAHVILIPKQGKDLKQPNNHRPISLLSTVGKTIEKLILRRLQDYVNVQEVIPEDQHAFRANYSTLHQLTRVVEYITDGFNTNRDTGAVFLDVAKAFDRVWHQGLIHKISIIGAPVYLTRVIASYLHNRSFKIKLQDYLSTERQIRSGVPQGSILGPLLFNIYMSDLTLNLPGMKALYADDVAILYKSTNSIIISKYLQNMLNVLQTWYEKWRLDVNADKSTAVYFTRKLKRRPDKITYNNSEINWGTHVQYLGVTLDYQLRFTSHIKRKLDSSHKVTGMLFPLLGRRSNLSLKNKVRLYKTVIRPHLLYACPIWANTAPTNLKRIEARQNRIIRMLTKAPWFIRNNQLQKDLKIPPVRDYIRHASETFYSKIQHHCCNSLVELASSYDSKTKLKFKRPRSVLWS